MPQASQGNTVKVHYTGRLDDGTVFDTSRGSDPIEFQIGGGMVIVGFDQGVTGLNIGESRTVAIPPEQAYGPHHAEAVIFVPRDEFPAELPLEIGLMVRMEHPSGQPIDMTVVAIADDSVTLDANHPLAGKTLHFDLELVSIG